MSEQDNLGGADGELGGADGENLPEANAAAATPEVAEAIRKEAQDLGWADRDHWRGRPEDFVEADEFVRMANRHLPIVNARLKNVTGQFEKAQAEWAKREAQSAARVADLERKQQEAEQRRAAQEAEMDRQLRAQSAAHAKMMDLQRQELLDRTEKEKREALMIDDPAARAAAYDSASQRERAAIKNLIEAERPVEAPRAAPVQAPQPKPAAPFTPEAETRAAAWMERNTWLRDNPELMKIAGQIDIPAVPTLNFNTNPEGHLDYIKTRLKGLGKAIPEDGAQTATSELVSQPNATVPPAAAPAAAPQPAPAQRGSPVEGASRRAAAPAPKERGFKELPPAAKTTCEDLIANKRLKGDPDKARKAYAAEYWAAYGDE